MQNQKENSWRSILLHVDSPLAKYAPQVAQLNGPSKNRVDQTQRSRCSNRLDLPV